MLDYQQALLSVVTLDLEAEHILNGMFAHFFLQPSPAFLMRDQIHRPVPKVYMWTNFVTSPSDHEHFPF
jgi:hypothetical protein